MNIALSKLHTALKLNKSLNELIAIFNEGVSLEEYDENGLPLLHLSFLNLRNDFIEYLLDNHNLNINQRNKQGLTVIQYMIVEKMSLNYEMIDYFVERGADLETTYQNGATALHLACMVGEVKAVERLINLGANIEALMDVVPTTLKSGEWRPLHIAAMKGYAQIVELLISKGAKKERKDYQGCTPLLLACKEGAKAVEAAIALVHSGANVKCTSPMGESPYIFARLNNQKELIDLLSKKGANKRESINYIYTQAKKLYNLTDNKRVMANPKDYKKDFAEVGIKFSEGMSELEIQSLITLHTKSNSDFMNNILYEDHPKKMRKIREKEEKQLAEIDTKFRKELAPLFEQLKQTRGALDADFQELRRLASEVNIDFKYEIPKENRVDEPDELFKKLLNLTK